MTKVVSFWRIVIQIGLADSLTWTITNKKEQRIYIFSINIVKRNEGTIYVFIIGPILFGIGVIVSCL